MNTKLEIFLKFKKEYEDELFKITEDHGNRGSNNREVDKWKSDNRENGNVARKWPAVVKYQPNYKGVKNKGSH